MCVVVGGVVVGVLCLVVSLVVVLGLCGCCWCSCFWLCGVVGAGCVLFLAAGVRCACCVAVFVCPLCLVLVLCLYCVC